jgi:hypothetical protein
MPCSPPRSVACHGAHQSKLLIQLGLHLCGSHQSGDRNCGDAANLKEVYTENSLLVYR